MAKKSTKQTVYALLVAVDDYREDITVNGAYFPKLGGCVNDVDDVLKYLQTDETLNLQVTFLKNQQATKPNIVAAFNDLAKKAKSKDVVLFYYSGHGTCETADTKIWTDQSNGRLEALVCYYDNDYSPSFLLVDKELRYLINDLSNKTKAHVVAISDCCHSGDNTRAVLEPTIVQRRVDFVFQQRKWEDFVFANQFKPEDFLGKSVNEVLPQGAHVQMSAAESDEPAVEVNGHGVFTTHLLEALRQTGGNISYQDLNNRIRNRMRVVFEQKPKLYAPDQFRSLLRKGFFKKPVGKLAGGTLVFNPSQKAWVLDKGVLHGIEAGKTEVEIRLPDGKTAKAKVTNAELDHAQLQLEADASKLLDKQAAYPAKLSGIQREVVKVRLVNKNALPGQEAEVLTKRLDTKDFVSFTDDEKQADFDLVMWDDLYYLSKPGDWFRPVVQPEHSGVAKAADALEDHLRHIANWMYFNRLANAGKNALPENLLSVQFLKVEPNGAATPIKVSNANVQLKLEEVDGGWGGSVKIVLTNKHTKNLYVAGIYQSEDFSCQPGLFEPHVKMIEPGASEVVFEHGGGVIPLQLDPKWYWYNWEKGVETVKFVFSTSNFDASHLEMAGLPMPLHPDSEQVGGNKGIFNLKKPALAGWGSVNFKLNIPNPTFNQDNQKKADGLLQLAEEQENQPGGDVSPSFFALGLYFERDGFNPQALAKKEVAAHRGFLWDTTLAAANKWASFWRRRRFNSALKEMQGKPILVAEGDSWFQHPLLNDVIDNVGKYYPVYCLSAAGDTIANYLRGGEFFEEIQRLNPAVFLLSGGGNDILGESMLGFLADQFPAQPQPADFFNQALANALTTVNDLYRQVFEKYKDTPLKIIVHGYDYPRPIAPGSKKTSWLGQYFDKKGIAVPEFRTAATHYLMDTFNESLKNLAANFSNVYYLDLRGIVNDTQWDDEIHPNDTGFELVAHRFVQKINELTKKKEAASA